MQTKEIGGAILMMAVIFMGTGCATIVSGTTQKMSVTSQPTDAIAKVDNNLSARTPATFTLERRHDHTIEISKEGYKTTSVMIKRTFNGMATGNVLLGGIIGGGIDAASGAGNKLVPERVDIILEEGEGRSEKPIFLAQKDTDYYEKNILKTAKVATPSAPASEIAKEETPKIAASTNFGPKPSPTPN